MSPVPAVGERSLIHGSPPQLTGISYINDLKTMKLSFHPSAAHIQTRLVSQASSEKRSLGFLCDTVLCQCLHVLFATYTPGLCLPIPLELLLSKSPAGSQGLVKQRAVDLQRPSQGEERGRRAEPKHGESV